MQMITIKARPKTIFGIILAATGVFVILLTFLSNHGGSAQTVSQQVSCDTAQKRIDYISSLGWQCDSGETEKQILIPETFNDVYSQYNAIQKQQGFDLEKYKGKKATMYTYCVTNYDGSDSVTADLIVYQGNLIGADLCDTDADNGFLVALSNTDGQT